MKAKRVLSLALAVTLCLGLLALPAGAAEYTVTEAIPLNSSERAGNFSEGLVWVYVDRKYGYIDKTGQEVIPPKYNGAGPFSEGLAMVKLDIGEKDTEGHPIYKWGFINKGGQEIVPPQYDDVSGTHLVSGIGFSEGLAGVRLNDKWGYIDKTGKQIIPFKYDSAFNFSEGLATVELGGKKGYIDKTGKEVIPCKYKSAGWFSGGLAAVSLNGKCGYIDQSGKEVIPLKYDSARDFSEGLAWVKLDGKWSCIDTMGREVIPFQYENVQNFSEGLAAVRSSSGWGYIDKTGQEVIPCKYSIANDFSEGFAVVRLNRDYGVIDKTGQETVPYGKYGRIYDFSEGFAQVELNHKYGFISVNAVLTAQPSTQTVTVDGKKIEFAMYALNNGSVNYIRVRDLAALLNGTAAQFEVGWDGKVLLTAKRPYTGSADKAPFNTEMPYTVYAEPTYVNGSPVTLDAIQIEYNGGGFTYYKLRDLAQALGFNVGWSAEKGVYVETNKPYDPNN